MTDISEKVRQYLQENGADDLNDLVLYKNFEEFEIAAFKRLIALNDGLHYIETTRRQLDFYKERNFVLYTYQMGDFYDWKLGGKKVMGFGQANPLPEIPEGTVICSFEEYMVNLGNTDRHYRTEIDTINQTLDEACRQRHELTTVYIFSQGIYDFIPRMNPLGFTFTD
jgi:hypothetical protein